MIVYKNHSFDLLTTLLGLTIRCDRWKLSETVCRTRSIISTVIHTILVIVKLLCAGMF